MWDQRLSLAHPLEFSTACPMLTCLVDSEEAGGHIAHLLPSDCTRACSNTARQHVHGLAAWLWHMLVSLHAFPSLTVVMLLLPWLPSCIGCDVLEYWVDILPDAQPPGHFIENLHEAVRNISKMYIRPLRAWRSVWEDVECKLRCVNFRRVSDDRSTFRLAFRLTGISDDWYRSTIGVIAISCRISWSAGENFVCIWEHLDAPESAGDKPGSADYIPGSAEELPRRAGDKPRCAGNKSGSTSNYSRAVCEKHYLLWERCWCAGKL